MSFQKRRKAERAAAATKEQSEKQEALNKRRDEENKQIRESQEKFDKEHNTQAHIARTTGSGKFSKRQSSGTTVTLTPQDDPRNFVQSQPNEFGGQDYVSHQREDLYFADQVAAERIRYASKEAVRDETSRAKLISQPTRDTQFLQSGTRESQAIIEYFNQYKSTSTPSKTAIIGFLQEKGITLSPRGEEFIDNITSNKGRLSSFGTSTFYDPKTKERFSARTGEGDIALAQKLGFNVAPQSPSLPANNNQRQQRTSPDVRGIEEFLSAYKSTSRPPRAAIEGFLQERDIPVTPRGEEIISEITANRGRLSDIDTSKFFDPQTNERFDAETNRGSQNLAFNIGKRDQKPPPDPLGISQGLQSGLDALADKAQETRTTLESNADFRTKGKAAIENFEAEFGTAALNIPASFVNLGSSLASAQEKRDPSPPINIPKESTEEIFFRRSFESPDIATGLKNIPSNLRATYEESLREKGFVGTVGSLAFTGLAILPLVQPAKAVVPFRVATLPAKTSVEGAQSTSTILLARVGERIKPIATKTTIKLPSGQTQREIKRGFDATTIDLDTASKIGATRAKAGAELANLGRNEEVLLSNEKTLRTLVQSGDITQDQATRQLAIKGGVKETKRVPDKPFREDFGEQPFENIARGKETDVVKGFFREKGIVVEGSAIDIPTFLPKYTGRAGDFDVHLAKSAQGRTFADNLGSRLNDAAQGGRRFESEGGKLTLFVGGKPDKTRPIFEQLKRNELIHGTSESNLDDIVNLGVDITKSKRGEGFFATGTRNLAGKFAQRRARSEGEQSAFAKITVDESKVLDIGSLGLKEQKQIVSKDWLKFQRNAIEAARERGFAAVRKAYGGTDPTRKRTETIILDESAIKSIEPIKPTGFKITGGRKIGKAGEFLADDDPESLGQLSKSGRVFGVKTSKKTPKTEGIKRKTLQFQIGRRGASSSSIFEGKFQPPINPTGTGTDRSKDLPRLYAGLKTAANIYKTKTLIKQPKKAARIDAYAETIKRTSHEIDFDEFFRSRKPITQSFRQQPKSSFVDDLGSGISKSTRQQSPFASASSIFSQSKSSLLSPSRTISTSSSSSLASHSMSSLISPSKSSTSKSKSSVSKSSPSLSKPSKSMFALSGKSSIYSGKSPMSPTKSGVSSSLSSVFGKSPSSSSLLADTPLTLTPPKTVITPLKFSKSKRRKYEGIEGGTQTRIFGVKNPFSDAFSIKGRKGGKIEPF